MVVLPDFILETVLRAGLTAMRNNPLRIDDLFEQMLEPYMVEHFGQADINTIKSWIANNRINIVQGFPQEQSMIPCISINLQAAVEATELSVLSSYAQTDEVEIPATIVASLTPTGYTSITKMLIVDDLVDLSTVDTAMLFMDADEDTFIITGVNNEIGRKSIQIEIGDSISPNISSTCSIIKSSLFKREVFNMIPIHEKLMIGVHSENAALTKYLYYIVIYILQARRDTLIRRYMELTHFTGTDFVREPQFLPENIYSRYIILDAITRMYYKQEEDQMASNSSVIVRVKRDIYPRDDEDSFNVRTIEDE